MRAPLSSLGSLTAIAGLVAAQQASAQLTLSSLSDISLADYNNNVLSLDINGDATTDFNIYVQNLFTTNLNGLNGSPAVDSFGDLALFNLGDVINGTSDFNGFGPFANFSAQGTAYVGVSFSISSQLHYGWLEFNFPTANFIEGSLVSAGWQATPGATATISNLSAVPEPATNALLGGLFVGLVASWRRFRSRFKPAT